MEIIELKSNDITAKFVEKSTGNKEKPEKTKWITRTEVDKHKDNVRTILSCSNATPIRRYGGIGYWCCFCTEQFANPAQLKTHTLKEHEQQTPLFMEHATMLSYMVKLDITGLECELCLIDMNSLEDLIDHLKSSHGKQFHTDIKDHIIPFKFNNGGLLKCVICGNELNNFKVLLEHMNTHFRNHVCEVCGTGFVNKRILQTHAARHRTGVFPCSYCSKVFNTSVKSKHHERAVHTSSTLRSVCGYCGDRFSDYTKKHAHEVSEHGATPVVLQCYACDKTYDNQRALTIHINTYHLMARKLNK